MLFNSLIFLVFLVIVLAVYPRLRLRGQNTFLLVASYIFYGYWDWRFNFLLLASTLVDFFVGQRLHEAHSPSRRKWLLLISLAANLGFLASFKYFNFFADSMAALLESIGMQPHFPILRVILPVGISFYTFQTMSYTIDIYRGKLEPTRNFIDFALFVSFFPQLVAGPIERATNLLPQICAPRRVSRQQVLTGLNLILLGYFKKVAIADSLAPIVEHAFGNPASLSSGQLLSGIYAFSFQIYGDFSGYTDIARGVSRILGIEIMENFNAPYLSRSITEFWRRWHISLSTWLRDYLYITLGGNRKGKARTYANLMITMFLGGLWHGAAWTFVAWGVMHGAFLAMHRAIQGKKKGILAWPKGALPRLVAVGKVLLTFHLVALTWILFRAPSFSIAIEYIRGIFRCRALLDLSPAVLFGMGLMALLDTAQNIAGSHTWLSDRPKPGLARYAVIQLMVASILIAAIAHSDTVIPFIYFQF